MREAEAALDAALVGAGCVLADIDASRED